MNLISGIIVTLLICSGLLYALEPDTAIQPEPLAVDTAEEMEADQPAASNEQQEPAVPVPAPIPLKISLFAPTQFDSLINLLPNGDSIRQNTQVMGIGKEQETDNIVVIFLDNSGNLGKQLYSGAELRPRPQTAIVNPSVSTKTETRGRTWFIGETTIKSGFTYGAAYGTLFEDEARITTGLTLLSLGGALYGSYAFTKNMELGYGKVAFMNYGSTLLGAYYPMLIASFLHNATSINDSYIRTDTLWGRETESYYSSPTTTDYIRAVTQMIGFPIGIFLGSRLKIADKDDYGKVAYMEYFSQTFGLLAFALPVFFNDHPGNQDYFTTSTALSMCLLPAGFYTGYRLGVDRKISSGRGTLLWITGAMGSLSGFGISMLGDDYHGIASHRAILAATIAGYSGGTLLGMKYHPQVDYTFWQSAFIGASSAVGAGIGVAFPLIADVNTYRPYIIASISGGWAGFFIGEWLSHDIFDISEGDKNLSNLHLNLPGLAALPLLFSPKTAGSFNAQRKVPAIPMADLEWRF